MKSVGESIDELIVGRDMDMSPRGRPRSVEIWIQPLWLDFSKEASSMEIAKRMAVAVSGLVFAGAAVLAVGGATQAAAEAPAIVPQLIHGGHAAGPARGGKVRGKVHGKVHRGRVTVRRAAFRRGGGRAAFHRFAHRRSVGVRGCGCGSNRHWNANRHWTAAHLKQRIIIINRNNNTSVSTTAQAQRQREFEDFLFPAPTAGTPAGSGGGTAAEGGGGTAAEGGGDKAAEGGGGKAAEGGGGKAAEAGAGVPADGEAPA
jgi:hypothetical protein